MSRELSRNRQRLAALVAFGVFWGALLITIGFRPLYVVIVIGGLLGVAALALEGPAMRPALLRGSRAVSARFARIDWQGLRHTAVRRSESAARAGRRAATSASGLAAAASKSVRQDLTKVRRRAEAVRLNEQAADLRQAGWYEEALADAERALETFRALGDRRNEALTLNGIGLTQARMGDEAGAVDSYETAAALLSELGDSHGAGRVLANLGSLHLGQGQDEQARATWHDALERLEPGSPEHNQTAQQLRSTG